MNFSKGRVDCYDPAAMAGPLARLLHQVVDAQFEGKKDRFAKAIDASPSIVSRVMNEQPGASFGLELCLRVAAATGRPPAEILTAAGKASAIPLIESLFGRDRAAFVRPDEEAILRVILSLDARLRAAVLDYATYLAARARPSGASAEDEAPAPVPLETRRRSKRGA